jgi:peptidoglycan/LPS O-acetylase OafA/YrhL
MVRSPKEGVDMSDLKQHLSIANLSLYRNEIYGACAMWIIAAHGVELKYIHLENISTLFNSWFACGAISVDIFLFLSGIGCFYSYYKNQDIDLFIKKRFARVLPSYIVFAIIYWAIMDFYVLDLGIKRFFFDLSLYSFWKNGMRTFWYVAFILMAYCLLPFIYKSMYDGSGKAKEYRSLSLFFWIATFVIFNAYLKNFEATVYEKIEIATNRFPIFILGCFAGDAVNQKKDINVAFFILCFALAFCTPYICNNSYFPVLGLRYTQLVLGVGVCVTLSVIFSIIKVKWVHNVFSFLGSISLELYIIHIGLRRLFVLSPFYELYCWQGYLVIIILSIPLSYLLSITAKKIRKYIVPFSD